jgi:hypothetical protein
MAKPEEEKKIASFTSKFKKYLTQKFQEKNSVRKKKHAFTLLFPVAFFFNVNHHFIST